MDFPLLLHHTVCGGLAAAGFGVLFNVGFRELSWCAVSGALMLAVRTVALGLVEHGSGVLSRRFGWGGLLYNCCRPQSQPLYGRDAEIQAQESIEGNG